MQELNWQKMDGLIPAVIQDAHAGTVLMLGYMNEAALEITRRSGHATFWSRSKGRLWTKGETSGHILSVRSIEVDCDGDALLILAVPEGPTCHTGSASCFDAPGVLEPSARAEVARLSFLVKLEEIIAARIATRPSGSYTTTLLGQGVRRMAQKVGEEGLEVALAAVSQSDQELIGETADLLFHTILLLQAKGLNLRQVVAELENRHPPKAATR